MVASNSDSFQSILGAFLTGLGRLPLSLRPPDAPCWSMWYEVQISFNQLGHQKANCGNLATWSSSPPAFFFLLSFTYS